MFAPSFVQPLQLRPCFTFQRAPIRTPRCELICPQPPEEPAIKPAIKPTIPRKQSLPTLRERLYLQSLHYSRPRGRAARYIRMQHITMMAWPLVQYPPGTTEPGEEHPYPMQPLPPWAYIVRVRASKSVIGKRAVLRNRAKRRVKAAATKIMPAHARRGWEYVFALAPTALTASFDEIVDEIEESLKTSGCWKEEMELEEVVRTVYCDRYR